jgi:hypothetical protein
VATRIIILGSVAGMCASHELIERGFEDMVLEGGDLARGTVRTIPLVHDTSGHQLANGAGVRSCTRCRAITGFDFSPLSTTSSTPSAARRHLNDARWRITWPALTQDGKLAFVVPAGLPLTPGDARTVLRDILLLFGPTAYLTPDDLWPILTSCKEFGSGNTGGRVGGISSAPSGAY